MAGNTASVQIVWPREEGVLFRTVVDAAVRTPGFRGLLPGALYPLFQGPASNFYRQNRTVPPGQTVKLVVTYQPGGQPPASLRMDAGQNGFVPAPQITIPMLAEPDKWANALTSVFEGSKAQSATIDFVVLPPNELDLRLLKFQEAPNAGSRGTASARQAITSLMNFLRMALNTPNPKVYTARLVVQNGAWILEGYKMLAHVEPIPADELAMEDGEGFEYDEGAALIADVHASRRLVLDTAAVLIAEQDPTRLDNMLMSVAPFAIMRIGKLGKLAKLTKLEVLKKMRVPRAAPLRRGMYHVDVPVNKALLERALELRKTKYGVELKDFKRNVTVWEVTVDGKKQFLDAGNIPIKDLNRKFGKGDVDVGLHSEGLLRAEIQKLKAQGKKVKVDQIYTERICCINCKSLLDNDDLLKNVPVFHSVNEAKGMSRAEALMQSYGILP
jgi:hypothetical protein